MKKKSENRRRRKREKNVTMTTPVVGPFGQIESHDKRRCARIVRAHEFANICSIRTWFVRARNYYLALVGQIVHAVLRLSERTLVLSMSHFLYIICGLNRARIMDHVWFSTQIHICLSLFFPKSNAPSAGGKPNEVLLLCADCWRIASNRRQSVILRIRDTCATRFRRLSATRRVRIQLTANYIKA